MARLRHSEGLVDAQEAVSDYLDALLGPAVEEAPVEEAAIEEAAIEEAAIEEVAIEEVAIEEVAIEEAAIEPTPPPPPLTTAPRPAVAAVVESPARPFAEPPRALLSLPLLLPRLPDVAVAVAVEEVVPTAPAEAPAPETAPTSVVPPVAAPAPVVAREPAPRREPAPSVPEVEKTPPPPPQAPPHGAPAWAANPFPCLGFKVAGVQLAAPLEKLHGIIPWDGELTGLPGYPDWFLGLLSNRGQNVRLIDTARIIMPDGRLPDARPVQERVRYLVLIDEGRWGLAADGIGEVMSLDEAGVKWRGPGSRRPWLAGTAVEAMCAVLDMDSLAEQLADGLQGLED